MLTLIPSAPEDICEPSPDVSSRFPLPELDPLYLHNSTEFPQQWENACQTHGTDFLSALNEIGATLEKCDPTFPTKYFIILHRNRRFTLQYSEITNAVLIAKLGKKNRMAVVHKVTEELLSYNKDMFYSTVHHYTKHRKNFESKLDPSLNYMLFHIVTDFLREQGFQFQMD